MNFAPLQFVSVKVTVDSECAEGNGVISNTNISKGAADEEKDCSELETAS